MEDELEPARVDSRLASDSSVGRPSWAGYLSLGAEDGDSAEGKRSALRLAAIRVSIDRTELSRSRKDGTTYTAYVISISCGLNSWNIRRRYTDFCYVHQQLFKQKIVDKLPSLPPKRFFGSSKDQSFVEDRRAKLEKYLNSLFPVSAVWNTPLLVTFLDNPGNTLMYLWNLERMRKMQAMITSMDIQTKDEAEELNAELRHARDQVKELQERVKRMEMLFLQGAAGVSVDVDVETLRSVSIGRLNERCTSLHSGNSSDIEGTEDSRSLGSIEDHIPFPDDRLLKSQLEREEIVEVLNLTKSIADVIEQAEMAVLVPAIARGNLNPRGRSVSVDMIKRALSTDSLSRSRDAAFAMSVQLQDTVLFSNKVLKDNFRLQSGAEANRSSHVVDIINMKHESVTANVVESSKQMESDIATAIFGAGRFGSSTEGTDAWIHRLFGRFDEVIKALQPSQEAIDSRNAIYQYLRGIVWNVLGVEILPVGSFVGRIFLLEGDLDMTVILPRSLESNSWFVKLNEVLCMAAMGLTSGGAEIQPFLRMQINNISFINAEVKIIKASINNISVDISANQIGSVYAQAFVEQCNEFIGLNHLLKKSILIIKAWCANESERYSGDGSGSLFGSNKGRLSSYSIIVMVVWIFNAFGHEIHSPVQALLHFLQYYSEFDWYRHALTVHGAVTIEDLSPLSDDSGQPSGRFIPDSVLLGCRLRYAELGKKKIPVDLGGVENKAGSTASEALMLGDTNSVYMRGILNVIDPIKEKRNITRSVDSAGFNAIRTGFRQGYLAFLEMAKMCREVPITDATLPESMSSKVPAAPISSPTAIRNADVPFVRSFLVNTTSVLKNAGRGRIIGSHNLADPFKSSNDEIESWIRHVELVFSPMSREALGSLVFHILKVKGPVPVGEIGKGLQEMTNNNSITELIKTEFKGLKRLIELCPEYFTLGVEHPFNPIVTVRPDAVPYFTDLEFIVSSLVPAVYGAAPSVAGDKVSKRSEDQVASHQLPPQHVSMNDGHFYPMQKGGSFKGEYASQMGRNHMMLKKAGSFIHTPSRAGSNNVNMKYSGGHGHQKRSDSFSSATTSNRTSDPDSIFYGSYVDSSSYSSATGEYMVQMGISPDMSAGMMYHSAAPPTQQSAAGAALSAGSVGVAYSPSRRNNNMTSRGGAGRGARGIVDGDV